MKKLSLLFALVLLYGAVFSQVVTKHPTPVLKKDMAYAKKIMKKAIVKPQSTKDFNTVDIVGTPIGTTNYDLQSNATVVHRFINLGNGKYSAVWTDYDGSTLPNAPERGTGYAHYDGSAWQFVELSGQNQHIEGSQRTGWPTLMTDGQKEYVVNHFRSAGGLFLWSQNIGAAATGWTSGSIEGYAEAQLWPRAVSTLGSDGNYHFYVLSVDDFNTGEMPQGLYLAQSHDGGQTWSSAEVPEFSTLYAYGNGDLYAIDARDSIVAFAYFPDYGDLTVWKSTDYGQTWDVITVNDFPVDHFDMNATMLDEDNNGTADTLETTDGCGDIIIDNNGKVHLVFGIMRVLDETQGDNYSYSYFPYTDGLLYWNEDMGEGQFNGVAHSNFVALNVPDSVQIIAYSFDLNGDSLIWDFADAGGEIPFGAYYASITSMPNLSTDDSGNVYVAFTTVMEGDNYVKTDANPAAQSYRHAWVLVRKYDGTWTEPYCVSVADADNAENVFPTVPRRITNTLPIWVQWDNEPGLAVRGDEDDGTTNYIVAKFIPVSEFGIAADTTGGGTSVIANLDVDVYPNPTTGLVYMNNVKNSNISVYNSVGQLVATQFANENQTTVDLTDMPAGMYIINVVNQQGEVSYKVLKK